LICDPDLATQIIGAQPAPAVPEPDAAARVEITAALEGLT